MSAGALPTQQCLQGSRLLTGSSLSLLSVPAAPAQALRGVSAQSARPGCSGTWTGEPGAVSEREAQACLQGPHPDLALLRLPKLAGLRGFCLPSVCPSFCQQHPFHTPSLACGVRAHGPSGHLGQELPWPRLLWGWTCSSGPAPQCTPPPGFRIDSWVGMSLGGCAPDNSWDTSLAWLLPSDTETCKVASSKTSTPTTAL